jgi:hypothetical protein
MTEIAERRYVSSVTRRLAGWLARLHKQLSDRIFADRDAFAIEHGWEITKTAGWFGFGGRIYRDRRFDGRRPPMLASGRTEARSRRAGAR